MSCASTQDCCNHFQFLNIHGLYFYGLYIEGLPNFNGYLVILVIVDRFTKYGHFIPVKHPFSSASIAQLFFDNVVKLHGVPKSIVCDRDKVFTCAFWKELFQLLKIDLKLTSAYHPQSDGQNECVNQCLEMFLRCSVQATPKQWTKWFSLTELWYNTSFHSSLNYSPFKALYAVDPHPGLFPSLHLGEHPDVANVLRERQFYTELLKENLAKAQNRMNLQVDHNRIERSFQVGEHVLLKLQPYAQSYVVNCPFPKLAFKYFGSYRVVKKLGKVAYKLELLADSLVHRVFHVSQLKEFTPDHSLVFSQLPSHGDATQGTRLKEGAEVASAMALHGGTGKGDQQGPPAR
jgi:hypothetical protein